MTTEKERKGWTRELGRHWQELTCEACIELESGFIVCQCLACDPDGTRYDCTCDETTKLIRIKDRKERSL